MTEIIPFSCPFCGADLEDLENLIIIVQGWPLLGWECNCCKRTFTTQHPEIQATIRTCLKKELRKRRASRVRKESYLKLRADGNIGLGVMV